LSITSTAKPAPGVACANCPVDNSRAFHFISGIVPCMNKPLEKWVAQSLRNDDGDVPGWVLITLMTAGLVIVIWGLAGPALANVFQQAIDRVTGF
jgi:hypothetical protein